MLAEYRTRINMSMDDSLMQEEPQGEELGQASLPLSDSSAQESLEPRIRGLDGLAQKALPVRAGAHLKPLTYWSSHMPRSEKRGAAYAPALYIDRGRNEGSEQGIRLLAPYGKQAARARQCTERFVLSSKSLALQGEGRPEDQEVFRPRALYALSHLVSGIQHNVPGTTLLRLDEGQPLMLVEPSPMLARQGYAVCGDNYRALEQDYADLATCMVRHERWNPDLQEWSLTLEEPLIDYFDTGRRRIARGREVKTDGNRRRYRNWHIGMSRTLLEMLKSRASEFTGLAPELWRAAGQSAPAQWLVCYLSGHGYDAGAFLPHRLDTLAFRMRSCSDEMLEGLQRLQGGDSMEVADFLATHPAGGELPRRATDAQFDQAAKNKAAAYEKTVSGYDAKQRSLRGSIRQVFRGLSRLQRSHAFADLGIMRNKGGQHVTYPIAKPGSFRQAAAHDRLVLRRWPALIERHLRSIPAWVFQQHSGLLESAGKAIGEVSSQVANTKGHLDWIMRKLSRAVSASPASGFLLAQLAWLKASAKDAVRNFKFSPITSGWHSPPCIGLHGSCPP